MKRSKANWGKAILPTIFFVAIAVLLAIPFMRSKAANPTLNNPNFETGPFNSVGTVSGWTVVGNVAIPDSGGVGEGSTSPTHGAALSAGADSQGDQLSQSFSTTSGQTYNVDFDAGIFGKRSGAPLQVNVQIIGSGTLVNQTITPPDAGTFTASAVTFQHYTIGFTANSATTTLTFTSVGSGNASADQIIDTVSVTQTTQTSTICNAFGAHADSCYQLRPSPCTSGQAFWFPNADCYIPEGADCVNGVMPTTSNPSPGTDGFKYVFTPGPNNTTETAGTFTENSNGTATLTGHLESTLHPGYGFDVNVSWSGLTTNPNTTGCNGPLLELLASCYSNQGGPVNPATWHFYSSVTSATLTGTGFYAGAIVQLTPVMHCFQVGDGASGKNIAPGASGWFSWVVLHQPNDSPTHCIRNASQVNRTADFNFNCQPGKCSGTGQIGDFVWNDTNQNGCQDAGEPGIPNVRVDLFNGCGANKTFNQTTMTDTTGHYLFSSLCAGDYTVSFTTPSGFSHTVANAACNVGGQPSDATDSDCACTGTTSPCDVCVTLPTNSSSDLTIDCGYIQTCPPPCVNPNLGLGTGAFGTVFQLGGGTVSITGPAGGIIGDVLIGPNGTLSMSGDEFITGIIKLAAGAKFSNSAHFTPTVQTNVDLSAQITAAQNRSNSAATLPCDQTFAKIDGSIPTINATHSGVNVICIKDVTISGKQVFITNTSNFANVTFILNITGQFALTGGGNGPQIRAGTNVKPADILFNLIGNNTMQVAFSGGGGGTNCCAAIIDGTLLALNRPIALSPGLVNGEVIGGKNISIVSGSAVKCPTCPQ
jgi:hypothetical protein